MTDTVTPVWALNVAPKEPHGETSTDDAAHPPSAHVRKPMPLSHAARRHRSAAVAIHHGAVAGGGPGHTGRSRHVGGEGSAPRTYLSPPPPWPPTLATRPAARTGLARGPPSPRRSGRRRRNIGQAVTVRQPRGQRGWPQTLRLRPPPPPLLAKVTRPRLGKYTTYLT